MKVLSSYLKSKYVRAGIIVIASVALLPSIGQCQARYTNPQFLLIAPDARGKSLGGGGSVFSIGAISAYYNPALLVTSEEFSGEYNYCGYMPKIADDLFPKNIYLSSNYRDLLYFGMGYSKFSYGEQERMDELGNLLGRFESYESALGFWAAITFDPDNSFGAGIKYIESHLAEVGAGSERGRGDASTVAFDFGILSRNHLPEATWQNEKIFYPDLRRLFGVERDLGFSFGVSIANLGEGLEYIDEDQSYPLPKRLRLGLGYQAIDSEPVGLRLAVDATKILVYMNDPFEREWYEIVWSYGLESTFYYLFSIRFGRMLDRDGHQRFNTIGFGIGPEWFSLDYSRVLDSDIDWNRRGDEYSISIRCNISPKTFKNF
ncbi:MAG: PorV/PorQ family protein [Candidatus Zixiibacteriota bacterium]|nr:MAG: PorV/PorQ family protein [candidate division Zixibacteria bacterium]